MQTFDEADLGLGRLLHTVEVYNAKTLSKKIDIDAAIAYLKDHAFGSARFKELKGSGIPPLYSSRPWNVGERGPRLLYTAYDNVLLLLDIVPHDAIDTGNHTYSVPARRAEIIARHQARKASYIIEEKEAEPNIHAEPDSEHAIHWNRNTIVYPTTEQQEAVDILEKHLTGVIVGVAGAGKTLTVFAFFQRLAKKAAELDMNRKIYYIATKAVVNQLKKLHRDNPVANSNCQITFCTLQEFLQERNPELKHKNTYTVADVQSWITTALKNAKKVGKSSKYAAIIKDNQETILQELRNISYLGSNNLPLYHLASGASQSLYHGAENKTKREAIFALYIALLENIKQSNSFCYELCDAEIPAFTNDAEEVVIGLDESQNNTPRNISTLLTAAQKSRDNIPQIVFVMDNAQNIYERTSISWFLEGQINRLNRRSTLIPTIILNTNLRSPLPIISMMQKIRAVAKVNCGIVAPNAEGDIHKSITSTRPGKIIWCDLNPDNANDILAILQQYARHPDTTTMSWTQNMTASKQLLNIADGSGIALDIQGENAGIESPVCVCVDLFNQHDIFDNLEIPAGDDFTVRGVDREHINSVQAPLPLLNAVYTAVARATDMMICINTTGHISRLEAALRALTPSAELTPLEVQAEDTCHLALERAQKMLDDETRTLTDVAQYLQHHVDEPTLINFIDKNTPLTPETMLAKITNTHTSDAALVNILEQLAASEPLQHSVIKHISRPVNLLIWLLRHPTFLKLALNNSNHHPFLHKLFESFNDHMHIAYKKQHRSEIATQLTNFLQTNFTDGRFHDSSMLFALASTSCGRSLLYYFIFRKEENQDSSLYTVFESVIINAAWSISQTNDPTAIPLLVLLEDMHGVDILQRLLTDENFCTTAFQNIPGENFAIHAPIRPDDDSLTPGVAKAPIFMFYNNFMQGRLLTNDYHQLILTFLELFGDEHYFKELYYGTSNCFEDLMSHAHTNAGFCTTMASAEAIDDGTPDQKYANIRNWNLFNNLLIVFNQNLSPERLNRMLHILSDHITSTQIVCEAIKSRYIFALLTNVCADSSARTWYDLPVETDSCPPLARRTSIIQKLLKNMQDILTVENKLTVIPSYFSTIHNIIQYYRSNTGEDDFQQLMQHIFLVCKSMQANGKYAYLALLSSVIFTTWLHEYGDLTIFEDVPPISWLTAIIIPPNEAEPEKKYPLYYLRELLKDNIIHIKSALKYLFPTLKACVPAFNQHNGYHNKDATITMRSNFLESMIPLINYVIEKPQLRFQYDLGPFSNSVEFAQSLVLSLLADMLNNHYQNKLSIIREKKKLLTHCFLFHRAIITAQLETIKLENPKNDTFNNEVSILLAELIQSDPLEDLLTVNPKL